MANFVEVWNSDLALSVPTVSEIDSDDNGTYYGTDSVINVEHANPFTVTSDGYIRFKTNTTTTFTFPRLYLDCHKLCNMGLTSEAELEFYSIKSANVASIGTKFGNHGTHTADVNGYMSYLGYVFGGYGVDFHTNDIHNRWEYWHDWQADAAKIVTSLPSTNPTGTLVGYKIRWENCGNRCKRITVWMDYTAGNGVWTLIKEDLIGALVFDTTNGSGPGPSVFPSGYSDSSGISSGPYTGGLHRMWIRLNPTTPVTGESTLMVKSIKIRKRST